MILGIPIDSYFWNLFVIALGLVVGSFLNVVIARLPEKRSLLYPGSSCPKCQSPVKFYDNIPVLSYLLLRGKCRTCKNPISFRYPVIELMTAFLFLAVKLRFGVSPLLFIRDFPLIAILVSVTFIDLEHRLIPDPLSLGGLVLGLITAGFVPGLGWVSAITGALLGFVFFYGIAWYYHWRTGKSGMGGGDIKLLAMLGAFIGPAGVLTTVLVSSVLGSIMGLAWAFLAKNRANEPGENSPLLKVSIPFGPFLVIGGLYYYLLGEVLWSPFMNRI